MDKKFEIPEDLLQQILKYLAVRPYVEVALLIQNLSKLKPINGEENAGAKTVDGNES